MFYILSKIFWILAQPLSLSFLSLACGSALHWWGKRRFGATLSVCGLLVLGLSSFTTLGSVLIAPLENRFVRPQSSPSAVSTIIMLGGATFGQISSKRAVVELNEAGDRLTTTLYLAKRYPDARILLSGGVGMLLADEEPEAQTAARFFEDQGIDRVRLILEGQSRNTAENAEQSAALLGQGGGTTLLVTSAFHMPRSAGLFEKAGVDVIPWPTDYRSTGDEGFTLDLSNPVRNISNAGVAVREWIGLWAYYLTGRLDNPFPGHPSN